MSFQGINFSSQHIVPSDDGRLYEAIFEDGALHGCELSYVGAALTIGAGYLMIGGREIEITEDEVFNINEATSGYAQLVLTIDLTQTATIGAFNQVSIDVRYASTEAGFASLIQDDINGAGTKYQQQLALVSLGTGGITGIVAGMPSASLKGAGRVFSIIAVTYPAGSTCTCSDGTTTLTARDTSGTALFNVPSAGTWTVSCTDGTNTKSKSVEITNDGQIVSVILFYGLYLYSKGNMHTDVGGDWSTSGYSRAGWGNFENISPKNTDEGLSISPGTQICVFGKENKVDLTEYSKLSFTLATNTTHQPQCFITSTKSLMQESNTVANIRFEEQTGEITLDISSISGSYYVAFAFYTGVCLIEEVKLT